MIVYLNGSFVPEDQALVSAFDRGFLYGDGFFETILLCAGRPVRWDDHMRRFKAGTELLHIPLEKSEAELLEIGTALTGMNKLEDCLLRINLSRGRGQRGYSPRGANSPTLVLSLHPLPEGWDRLRSWRLVTSRFKANDTLGSVKNSSKLVQVLARAEAEEAGADDALLLTDAGHVAETTSSNVFWILNGEVCTPPLDGHLLPGITRRTVLEICEREGITTVEISATPDVLKTAEGVFLTQTTLGIIAVASLDDHALAGSPFLKTLHRLLTTEMRV